MAEFKVTEGSWKGQVGEFVRHEIEAAGTEAEKIVGVVLRMPAGRLVEFAPERVDKVVEPPAEPKGAE